MRGLHVLAAVLRASVARKGEVPLTNAHLLNIVNLAIRAEEARDEAVQAELDELMAEELKWGK